MATKPFFVPKKELDLIDSMNEELIDEIVGQAIDIYKVSMDETNVNIYGEAEDGIKRFEAGYRVNCLIQFNEPVADLEEFGKDITIKTEVTIRNKKNCTWLSLKIAVIFPRKLCK